MNKNHLQWAKQHDWGKSAFLCKCADGSTKLCLIDLDGDYQEFVSVSDLRDWAGY